MTTSNVTAEGIREETREIGRRYRSAWIRLGQLLYSIHKDKHFKQWGYLTFEAYCMKELKLKESTAQKIIKSYSFLEKEEPRLVDQQFYAEEPSQTVPDYEAVNLLRLAKQNEKLTPDDFSVLRESVLDKGREAKEVRQQVRRLIEEKEDPEAPEIRNRKRNAAIRRLITTLKTTERELKEDQLLPDYLLKQMDELMKKLEDQIQ